MVRSDQGLQSSCEKRVGQISLAVEKLLVNERMA